MFAMRSLQSALHLERQALIMIPHEQRGSLTSTYTDTPPRRQHGSSLCPSVLHSIHACHGPCWRAASLPRILSVASQNGATVAISTRSSGLCAPLMVGP